MLQPLKPNRARRRVAVGRTIPAPVEGLDLVSPLSQMDAKRAPVLDNWFPQPGYVELRNGCTEWAATGESSAVESLLAWHGPTSAKLFGAAGTTIYDVTSSGAPAATTVTTLTSRRLKGVNVATSGGNYLWVCNGADAPRHFDGTTWAAPVLTFGGGLASTDINHVTLHKKRLWFVFKDSLKAGYLAPDTIAGAVTTFDLGAHFTRGGKLVAIGTQSVDGGDGPDDLIVFVTSKGQVAIYQGTDPSSASTWALVGVYTFGPPLGDRCLLNVGSDLALLTIDGVLPLSAANLDRSAADRKAITARISPGLNADARLYSANYGWQLIGYPRGTAAILNVPTTEGSAARQYVMNTVTGAWCRFTGWNAVAFEVFNDALYFGAPSGKVYKADTGAHDAGTAITADMQCAYNYLGQPGVLKQFGMIQPLLTSNGVVTPTVTLDVDYREAASRGASAPSAVASSVWDSATWDSSTWPEEQSSSGEWLSVPGIGQACAVRLRLSSGTGSSDLTVNVNGFHILFSPGEIL